MKYGLAMLVVYLLFVLALFKLPDADADTKVKYLQKHNKELKDSLTVANAKYKVLLEVTKNGH